VLVLVARAPTQIRVPEVLPSLLECGQLEPVRSRQPAVARPASEHEVLKLVPVGHVSGKQMVHLCHIVVFEGLEEVEAAVSAPTLVPLEDLVPTIITRDHVDLLAT
jgi:hypothetical protein